MYKCCIIAEAGVNHNGDEKLAHKLIEVAYESGADIVKFQTFKAKNIVTEQAPQAKYQIENTGVKETQFEMLSRLELSFEAHIRLIDHCNQLGIEFLSTAFDEESLDFLVNTLHLKTLKIPSGELTNAPLVLSHARTGCSIILSTGMATLAEIEKTLGVIAFGFLNPIFNNNPTEQDFETAYASHEGQNILQEKVTILHCTSEYPAPLEEVNLLAMKTMQSTFKLKSGYSDHTDSITIPIAAAALGAKILEKHFTLDKKMEGPDHKASLDPNELKAMVTQIRQIEIALGNGIKYPQPSEIKNKEIARKSIILKQPLNAGSIITKEHITIKRPGTGMSPYQFWSVIGTVSRHDYSIEDLLDE